MKMSAALKLAVLLATPSVPSPRAAEADRAGFYRGLAGHREGSVAALPSPTGM